MTGSPRSCHGRLIGLDFDQMELLVHWNPWTMMVLYLDLTIRRGPARRALPLSVPGWPVPSLVRVQKTWSSMNPAGKEVSESSSVVTQL